MTPLRSRMSSGKAHACLRCNNPRLRWDPEDQEWYCTIGGCGARFPDRSTDPEASLEGPVERVKSEQPVIAEPQAPCTCVRIGNLPGIRCLRKSRGWSQADLAELIRTTRESVSDWENGRSSPSLEVLFRLLDAGQVTLEALRCNRECAMMQKT